MKGKVARRRPIALAESFFVRDNASALPKVTLPAPSTMHFWRGSGYADAGVYASPREFFRDLAAIYRAEIADLAAAGCRGMSSSTKWRSRCFVRPRGAQARGRRRQRSGPAGRALCRGDQRGARRRTTRNGGRGAYVPRQSQGKILAEGGYDDIAKALFALCRRDAFPARIRHRARRRFRAFAPRRGRQGRGARPRQLQERRARTGRGFAEADRGSGALYRQGTAGGEPAMRLRQHRRGNR